MADVTQQESPEDIEAYLSSVKGQIPAEDYDAYANDIRKQYGAPAPSKPNGIVQELKGIYTGATTPALEPAPGGVGPRQQMAEPQDAPWQTAMKLGGEATSRAIGVPAGIAQALARYARGISNPSEPLKAIVGMDGQRAPRVADALKDAGVPELGSTQSLGATPGGAFDFTGRDALGALAEAGAYPASGAIKNALRESGRVIYRQPFNAADAAIATKWRANFGKHAGSDFLYNEGKPLVGGFGTHPSEYADAMQKLKEKAWGKMEPHLENDTTAVEIAPQLDQTITKHRIAEAGDQADNLVSQAKQEFEASEAARKKQWQKDNLTKMANLQQPEPFVPGEFQEPNFDPSAAFESQTNKDWLKSKIQSTDKDDNALAIKLLSEHAPDYAATIKKMGAALSRHGGDREQVLPVLDSFIENAYQGPRTIRELHDLGTSYSSQARRNQQMGADMTARNSLRSEKKAGQMNVGSDIADVTSDKVDELLGPEGSQSYKDAKKEYAIAKKLQDPMTQLAKQYGSKHAFTAVDGALGTLGLMRAMAGDPTEALMFFGKKGAEQFSRPRLATGVGSLLGKASQSNIWDRLLQRRLLTSPEVTQEQQ